MTYKPRNRVTKKTGPFPPFLNRRDLNCNQGNAEMFFPVSYGPDNIAFAIAECKECPVQRECAAWAIVVGETDGVWGGTTPLERRKWRETHSLRELFPRASA